MNGFRCMLVMAVVGSAAAFAGCGKAKTEAPKPVVAYRIGVKLADRFAHDSPDGKKAIEEKRRRLLNEQVQEAERQIEGIGIGSSVKPNFL